MRGEVECIDLEGDEPKSDYTWACKAANRSGTYYITEPSSGGFYLTLGKSRKNWASAACWVYVDRQITVSIGLRHDDGLSIEVTHNGVKRRMYYYHKRRKSTTANITLYPGVNYVYFYNWDDSAWHLRDRTYMNLFQPFHKAIEAKIGDGTYWMSSKQVEATRITHRVQGTSTVTVGSPGLLPYRP